MDKCQECSLDYTDMNHVEGGVDCLRRQLAAANERAEKAEGRNSANDRAIERIKNWCATPPQSAQPPEMSAAESYVCERIMEIIINEQEADDDQP